LACRSEFVRISTGRELLADMSRALGRGFLKAVWDFSPGIKGHVLENKDTAGQQKKACDL
jgi:hypothetical protein